MKKIKVSELFYSLQGEGRFVGIPSIFLRTFGCNFKCEGFGMPLGQKSNERNEINVELYKDYKELPLVKTGCDSYASWDPRFKHLSPVIPVDSLAKSIVDLLPNKRWEKEHLVITGGEPLLGWQSSYIELLTTPEMLPCESITFETNGTQRLQQDLQEYLLQGYEYSDVTFSVSPKLHASGEKWADAIRPDIVAEYGYAGTVYLKFVVSTRYDVAEAQRAVKEYEKDGFDGQVYLMPVGGTDELYYLNNKQVAQYAMDLGWGYSPRLQVDLWKNSWGT